MDLYVDKDLFDKIIKGRIMKRLLTIILTLAFASLSYGDAFKLMTGLNLSRYSVSPQEKNTQWSHKMGFCVGGGFEFDITDHIVMEVDWLLLQKGSRVKFKTSPDVKTNYSLRTISSPIFAQIKFKRDFPFYVIGGGEVSLILSHGLEKEIGENVDQQDLKENTKSFDFGLVFGCGCEAKVSQFQSFFVEARYQYGLANVLMESQGYESMKTNTILFILGIKSY